MASGQDRSKLDARARHGEIVVPGGTGGKSLEAQEHLAQGRSEGGQTRKEQLGTEGYQDIGSQGGQTRKEQLGSEGCQEIGSRGGQTRKEQIGTKGYKEMGHKGGLGTKDKSSEDFSEPKKKGSISTSPSSEPLVKFLPAMYVSMSS